MSRRCPVSLATVFIFGVILVVVPVTLAQTADDSWAPPDIDQVTLPANTSVPCPLDDVLASASKRVQELVQNMQRFSATEYAEFQEVDRHGVAHSPIKAKFEYVAYISETAPHQLNVDEYRNDSAAVQEFPSKLATVGTGAFALIFHPDFLKDFQATCEGLTDWNGQRAWRIHLVQIRPNNFRGYRSANRYFPVMLKVRAWIDAGSFEVLRLETSLLHPIKELPLELEHVIVNYGQVTFPRRNLQLWLPQSSDLYMDYRGQRYHHSHRFSDFQLFWVDTTQKVKSPKNN